MTDKYVSGAIEHLWSKPDRAFVLFPGIALALLGIAAVMTPVVTGFAAVYVLGAMVLTAWPIVTVYSISVLTGLSLLFTGAAFMGVSVSDRREDETGGQAPDTWS